MKLVMLRRQFCRRTLVWPNHSFLDSIPGPAIDALKDKGDKMNV